ncbi:MAG: ATP-dependent sacrificial sulfur transferase LarE [Micrococcales bacterium]|nr:ATP-dependent sacrificial sulfur transferase LarE [Micrococcales bacterium]
MTAESGPVPAPMALARRVDLGAELPSELARLDAEVGRLLRQAMATGARGIRGLVRGDGVPRLGVAFSGGVDSGLLLALAVRHLGAGRVVAVIGVSPSLAADERRAARDLAVSIGAPVLEVATHEGDVEAYRTNGPDRCFHCKDELFTRISEGVAGAHGLLSIAYGENADDAERLDRPGARAATEHGVLRPLAEAGLTKADVRAIARALGLPNADKPAAPCLASRIPHFQRVDPIKLRQIEALEHDLHDLGFIDCRVRHHGQIARIELLEADLERAMTPDVRARIAAAGRSADFTFVAIDVSGIQSGAFTLPLVQLSHD